MYEKTVTECIDGSRVFRYLEKVGLGLLWVLGTRTDSPIIGLVRSLHLASIFHLHELDFPYLDQPKYPRDILDTTTNQIEGRSEHEIYLKLRIVLPLEHKIQYHPNHIHNSRCDPHRNRVTIIQ